MNKKYAENYTIDELMISRMSKEIHGRKLGQGGGGFSGSAILLAKKTHAPEICTLGPRYMLDTDAISLPTMYEFQESNSAIGYLSSHIQLFDFVVGGKWTLWMSPAQIDMFGNVNISAIGDWLRPKAALVGCRGIPDNTVNCDEVFYYVARQSKRIFVEKVDFVVGVGRGPVREKAKVTWGQPSLVVTNLGVFDFEEESGRMRVASVNPGVTLEEIIENTGFELVIPNGAIPTTELPTEEEVYLLRNVIDPMGLNKVEAGISKKNIQELLSQQESYFQGRV